MKWKIYFVAFLWPFLNTFAQPPQLQIPPGGFQIGDKLPDEIWHLPLQIVSLKEEKTITLNDYKGKLLILEFGGTYCPPCIRSIAHLEDIQPQFKGRMHFLPITGEEPDRVRQFLEKRNWDVSYVADDNILKKLFPHAIIPHMVWIYNGQVKAISRAYEATPEHIRHILEGKPANWPMKRDVLGFSTSQPLLIDPAAAGRESLLWHSAFTGYIEGLPASVRTGKGTINIINASPLAFFKAAFGFFSPYSLRRDNRLILQLPDSLLSRMRMNVKGKKLQEKREKYTYCYSLSVPEYVPDKQRIKYMQEDINRYFRHEMGIEGYVEKRRVRCLVLERVNPGVTLKSKGGKPESIYNDSLFFMRNIPFRFFVVSLLSRHASSELPIVNATGITGNVDMEIHADISNLQETREELKKIGLSLRETVREIDMLVISQIDKAASDPVP